jgi:hypothetical protein
MFNNIALDGYFADHNSDISWTQGAADDTEFNDFISANTQGCEVSVFGRRT